MTQTWSAQAGLSTDRPIEDLFLWRRSPEFRELFGIKEEKDNSDYTHVAEASLIAAGILIVAAIGIQPVINYTGDSTFWHATWRVIQLTLIGVAILCASGCIAKYVSARKSFMDRVRLLKAASVNEELASLSDQPSVAQLYRLNRKQLDEYHTLSVRQQKMAFQAAQLATGLAFIVLVGGAVLSVTKFQPGEDFKAYVSGGLTALGTLLGSFLAKTFYDSYRNTSEQLALYYRALRHEPGMGSSGPWCAMIASRVSVCQ